MKQMPEWLDKSWRAAGVLALLGLLAVFGWRVAQALRNPPSLEYQRQGEAFLADGRLPEAVLSFRQAVAEDPANAQARSLLADAYRAQGRLRMAARYAEPGMDAPDGGALTADWIFTQVEAPPAGAALDGDLLVAAYEDGMLLALRLPDGGVAWQVKLPGPLTSAPALDEARVYVGAQDGSLYALRRADGGAAWTFASGGPIFAAATLDAGRVYCPSSDGSLYALDAASGALLWSFRTRGALHGAAVSNGERVVFGSYDGRLYALDAASGAPTWGEGFLTGGPVESQPAIEENRVIAGSGDGRAYALALDSGGLFWRISTPDAVYAAPVVADGVAYIVSSGRTLSAVELVSGEKRWQAALPGSLRHPPAVTETALYLIVEADAGLYRVDRASGAVELVGATGDWVAAGPWRMGERLYLLGRDGAVLAYPLPR